MKQFLLLLSFLCLFFLPVMANDGVYYTSGNQLVPMQETDISVRKEVLTITLLDSSVALVDVYYEFFNPNATAKTVLMGFEADPPSGDYPQFSWGGRHPFIGGFTVEMNGRTLSFRNGICLLGSRKLDTITLGDKYQLDESGFIFEKATDRYPDVAFVYYFDAVFQPGFNRVHHTYTFRPAHSNASSFSVDYKLTPAARWANGQIDDFTLVVRAHHTAKHFVIADSIFPNPLFTLTEGTGKHRHTATCFWQQPGHEFSLRNGSYTLHVRHFKPCRELSIVSADNYLTFQDFYADHIDLPFGFFYDRTSLHGLWYQAYMLPRDEAFRRRIARNLPYAHRGRVFKSPELQKYFESLWWYMPDPDYVDDPSDFTECDREYIKWGKGE